MNQTVTRLLSGLASITWLGTCAGAFLAMSSAACSGSGSTDKSTESRATPQKTPAEPKKSPPPDITTCLAAVAPAISSALPFDTPVADQPSLDCFAWQEFIALNWPANPNEPGTPAPSGPDRFGRPGALEPTVWETFMDVHEVMTPDGSAPPPWGSPPTVPEACRKLEATLGKRALRHTSKFSVGLQVPDDLAEAAPFGQPNWLADRDGNVVFFEIVMNQDEFGYIVENAFYNATAQQTATQAGTHIDVPRGLIGAQAGSIELKAAWLAVDDPSDRRWQRYKLSEALVWNGGDHCARTTVALVGLHIIHKTTSNPQWTWATFEHVDNAPTRAEVDAGQATGSYTFYNAECKPLDIDPACLKQETEGCAPLTNPPAQTSCEPNQSPAYCLDIANSKCPPYPVQVTRAHPIQNTGDNQVALLNQEVQALIRKQAGSDSVWQYYQLVGVLWSAAPDDENLPGTTPAVGDLSVAGMRPNPVAQPLANTTMETYVQNLACVDCHRSAHIAGAGQRGIPEFTSDYSFVFQKANPSAQ